MGSGFFDVMGAVVTGKDGSIGLLGIGWGRAGFLDVVGAVPAGKDDSCGF
jgi:hypothetical protein